ncbi:Coiled-coil domain-containing protein 112 [Phytophthora citrophthora]|uniref:Coiled-coil domain-containing protein 112 n=1 Tax=Phytophthora citrophthora TaxID=4793 RepID=A0AAD9GZE5_9STRA|nr:Coiled-coil domain-containing protein 112 [Phytophthora citrophthora]
MQQPVDPLASRTVDAIVEERMQDTENTSTSTRLRDKVAAARRGVQTERRERSGDELRPPERINTTRKIAGVRRRMAYEEEEKRNDRRRMGKQEAEWMEKQLQYKARVAMLEKECRASWQSFFAGAGTSSSSTNFVSAAEINKLVEEMETVREQDVYKMKQELSKLSNKVNNVQAKVMEIENGEQFFSELQETIDMMEAALETFRLQQRKQLEEYVLEERIIEKDLLVFMEKLDSWENETLPQLRRGGASTAFLGPKMMHLNSTAALISRHVSFLRKQSESGYGAENVKSGNQDEDSAARFGTPDELGMVDRVRSLNDAILRSGGLQGGWDHREHSTFATLLVKCGLTDELLLQQLLPPKTQFCAATNQDSNHEGQPKTKLPTDYETCVSRFLRKCMRTIVTQTESTIRSHFEWYLRHLELVEEKKRVIREWKARKEEERQQIVQCGFDADGQMLENFDQDGNPGNTNSKTFSKQGSRTKLKSREKTERLLEQWKQEKKQKDEEREQRRRELQMKRDAVEAKVGP